MDSTQNIQSNNQTDDEILAEIKRLSSIISIRRRVITLKQKPKEPPKKRGPKPKKVKQEETEEKKPEETEEKKPEEAKKKPCAEWRYKSNGKYDKNPIDPEYFKIYWREHFQKPYTCLICEKVLSSCGIGCIKKHERSAKCQRAKLKKEEIIKENENIIMNSVF